MSGVIDEFGQWEHCYDCGKFVHWLDHNHRDTGKLHCHGPNNEIIQLCGICYARKYSIVRTNPGFKLKRIR
jgi:hypothetical protein